jgi:hypothetical protein
MKIKTKVVLYLTAVVFLAAFGTGLFYYWIVKPSQLVLDAGEKIAEGVAAAFDFTPRVTTKNTIIYEEKAAILEVAVYSQRIIYDYEYTNTWLGSTKELMLKGVYLAKYGFNLKKQNFTINITEDKSAPQGGYNLTFNMPQPILLSLETETYRVIRDRDGWWNKIKEEDREDAVNFMLKGAKEKALTDDYRDRVKSALEEQLQLITAGLQLEIRINQITFNWKEEIPEEEIHGELEVPSLE